MKTLHTPPLRPPTSAPRQMPCPTSAKSLPRPCRCALSGGWTPPSAPKRRRKRPRATPEALQEPEARLPHERDEATDMTGGIPSREVRQAYEDVTGA